MRQLALAFLGEGPTDYRFLSQILRRATDLLCRRHGKYDIEIPEEMVDLRLTPRLAGLGRVDGLRSAVAANAGSFNLLFLHVDGDGDPHGLAATCVAEPLAALAPTMRERFDEAIAVVPVRETEAWALADGDALQSAFGSTLSDQALGLPTAAHEVEGIADPKLALEQAYRAVVGLRRRRGLTAARFLDVLGRRVALDRLAKVPSFAAVQEDLRRALTRMGCLAADP